LGGSAAVLLPVAGGFSGTAALGAEAGCRSEAAFSEETLLPLFDGCFSGAGRFSGAEGALATGGSSRSGVAGFTAALSVRC